MAKENRFANLDFECFRRLANEPGLSKYERIGFPDSYREGHEPRIFEDVCLKLTNLSQPAGRVLDIGPGCSDLPFMLLKLCEEKGHRLTLVDSEEMLTNLPDYPFCTKIAGIFPNCPQLFSESEGAFDAILCYSVLHYIFIDTAFFRFVDASLSLLAPGGQMLIGDIPNVSKRNRFFASAAGIRFHQEFMKTDAMPTVDFNAIRYDLIDDSVVFSILQRARAAGFDAYILPQTLSLPMANRREDILIVRP
jgi:hypothetical protein